MSGGSWSRDGRCGEVVLVETPTGRWPRICIDAQHAADTDHHLRYDGVVVAWTDGLSRVHISTITRTPDDGQPVLV